MDDLFKWASNINVSYIIRFHQFILGELGQKERELDEVIADFRGDRKRKVDLLVERDLYAVTYKQHLMTNTFLLLYSHLEEWLLLLWKTYGDSIQLNDRNRGSISRFTPVVKNALHLDPLRDQNWRFLLEAEKIRNCLLHANARIDLSRNSLELRTLVEDNNGSFSESNSRLYVHQPYVEKFFLCVQYIISKANSSEET